MQSYNEIIALLGDMAASHGMVHSFHDGTEQVQLNGRANILYPAVFAKPEATLVKDKVVDHEFTLMACDLVTPAGRSRNEVLSDCQQILYDFLKALQSLPQITILPGARIRPFEGRFGDDTAGQEMTIVLRMNFDQNLCNIPMTGFGFPGVPVSLSGTPGSQGTSGFSGYSGYSGYNGLNGVPGASGYSGQPGGLSGTSGYSGAAGGILNPAPPNKSIQYNDAGAFGGSSTLLVNNAVTNVILNAGNAIPLFAVSRDEGNAGGLAIGTNVAGVPTARWGIGADGTAEAGVNTGTDFLIASYDDAGALIANNVTITRETSAVVIDANATGDISLLSPTKKTAIGDPLASGNGTYVEVRDDFKFKTITLEGGQAVRHRTVDDADATIVVGDFEVTITDITASRYFNLPAAPAPNSVFVLKGLSTAALIGYFTIIPDGTDTIDGQSHFVSYTPYDSFTIMYDGVSNWEVISSHKDVNYQTLTYVSTGSADGLVTNTGTEGIVAASPNGAYDKFIVVGVYLTPINIVGTGTSPIINIGNETGSFSNVLSGYTVTFPTNGNTDLLTPSPIATTADSWVGKQIKYRVTTATTGYTAYTFAVRMIIICIP